jgi:membrane protein
VRKRRRKFPEKGFLRGAWSLARAGVEAYFQDEAASRGAAIAFYAAAALPPAIVAGVAMAGAIFGQEAAHAVFLAEARGMIGPWTAHLLRRSIMDASGGAAYAGVVGGATLLLVETWLFMEVQSALNAIWKSRSRRRWYWALLASGVESAALAFAAGAILFASLVAAALIGSAGDTFGGAPPALLYLLNFLVMQALVATLFGAIYKILPKQNLTWRDVAFGAIVTTVLFQIGQTAVGIYLGSAWAASVYGAAGGIAALLIWIYYSAQVFLLGAEFTKVFAERYGSKKSERRA